ncbi:MAG: hypothetical protein WCK85_12605, partial [Chlorobium sp.]
LSSVFQALRPCLKSTQTITLGCDYVCDGIIGKVAQLGKGYRSSYNEAYKDLKERGLFFRQVQE